MNIEELKDVIVSLASESSGFQREVDKILKQEGVNAISKLPEFSLRFLYATAINYSASKKGWQL